MISTELIAPNHALVLMERHVKDLLATVNALLDGRVSNVMKGNAPKVFSANIVRINASVLLKIPALVTPSMDHVIVSLAGVVLHAIDLALSTNLVSNVHSNVTVEIVHNVFLQMELVYVLLVLWEIGVKKSALKEHTDKIVHNDVSAKTELIARRKMARFEINFGLKTSNYKI